ncbi:hypothetical protein SAMN05421762_0942 [Pseudooceanicola nitratireducens]|jgi:hypothetical protein|uniref:Uncharacterized protein n=1 Tax=Pseudooceanicola nitratireducens TaxID=517719 RepID=A0A1I1JE68_9RHOB|nr:hypothetical protein [Pseudooceanicola nitratireducens]SEJ30161.1 hypothetical protein SAMN05216183_102938 [Pseudooceanicola nitratireducens]SFC44918.1 hypothetical protein SAMN05421762_0942 [Pseudooceanicola nitratireducens]
MFDHIRPDTFTTDDPFAPLREFAASHREALINAAALLGGSRGARLSLDALDGLTSGISPARRTRSELAALLELLSLENVHDETREEAARFAAIDPADPIVEEICELTDGLRDALEPLIAAQTAGSRRVAA